MSDQLHEMIVVSTDEQGRDRLECIECPRVVLLTWPDGSEADDFSPLEIIVAGEDRKQHGGAKGPITLTGMTIEHE